MNKKPALILFLLAFLLYANTIPFEFALDDKLAISENAFTKKGIDGIPELLTNDMFVGFFGKQKNLVEGGRYRPLSMVMFAIEWEFFGPKEYDKDKPSHKDKILTVAHVGHFLNAIFYGLTAMVIFYVLCLLFPIPNDSKWYFTLPFVVTALYMAHPIHTEVVANVKSRDEIIGTLGGFYALYLILKFLDHSKILNLLVACIVFFLAMSSKESAITFVGVIPLTLFFFRKEQMKKIMIAMIPILVATGVYMVLRSIVLGDMIKGKIAQELMNDSFILASTSEKFATIVYTLGLYIKLLVFPISLTHDYYPWYPLAAESYKWGSGFPYMTWSNPGVLISLIAYALISFIGIKGLIKFFKSKEKPNVYVYSILFYLGTFMLFTNIFFPIGTFMNERFMYLPSFGFILIVGYFLTNNLKNYLKQKGQAEKVGLIIFVVILGLYSVKTIARNKAWENDATLATTDAEKSTTSAKVNMSAGGSYLDLAKLENNQVKKQELLNKSYKKLYRAIELYPTYIQPMILMGTTLFEMKEYDKSITYFENCFRIDKDYQYTINNVLFLGDTLAKLGLYDLAIKSLNVMITYHPQDIRAYSTLGEIYGKNLNNLDKSLEYLTKAYSIDSKNANVIQKIGVVYAIRGDIPKALEYFNSALEIDPNNAHVLMNVGLIYQNNGDPVQGKDFLDRAFTINPSLKK